MGIQTTQGSALKSMTISATAILISNAGFGWAATDLGRAQRAYITCYTQPINVSWAAGVAPTAALGVALAAGATIELVGNENINALQFIRQGATDGVISVLLEF